MSVFNPMTPACALFLMLFLSVDPNPRTPYVGCHATHADSFIFIPWVLLLFYDTGAAIFYHATWCRFADFFLYQ